MIIKLAFMIIMIISGKIVIKKIKKIFTYIKKF